MRDEGKSGSGPGNPDQDPENLERIRKIRIRIRKIRIRKIRIRKIRIKTRKIRIRIRKIRIRKIQIRKIRIRIRKTGSGSKTLVLRSNAGVTKYLQ